MATRSVDVYLRGYNKLSGPMRRAGMSTGFLSGRLSALKMAGIAAATALAFRLVTGIGTAIKSSAEFEKQLASVNTMLTEQTVGFLPEYGRALEELSVKYGQSTATLSKGLYDILSASIGAADAIEVLDIATQAAIGGMTKAEIAADALTTILNSYNMAASQAADVSDMLFATVKRGKLTYEELAQNIGKVAATAASSGVSLKELLAIIASLTRQGIKADMAMNAVSQMILKTVNPAKEARGVWKSLGIEFGSAAIKARGISGIMEQLSIATPEQIAKMFPKKASLGVNALRKNIDGLKFDLNAVGDSAGDASDAFNKMAGTTAQDIQRLKQYFADFGREVGDTVIPALKLVAPIFLGITESVKVALIPIRGFLEILEEIAEKVKKIPEEVSTAVMGYSATLDADLGSILLYRKIMNRTLEEAEERAEKSKELRSKDIQDSKQWVDKLLNEWHRYRNETAKELIRFGSQDVQKGIMVPKAMTQNLIEAYQDFARFAKESDKRRIISQIEFLQEEIKKSDARQKTYFAEKAKWEAKTKVDAEIAARKQAAVKLLAPMVVGLVKIQETMYKAMGGIRAHREFIAKEMVKRIGLGMGAIFGPVADITPSEAIERKRMIEQPRRGVEAFTARFLKRAPGATPAEEAAKNSKDLLKIQKKALKASEDNVRMLRALLDSGAELVFANIGGA